MAHQIIQRPPKAAHFCIDVRCHAGRVVRDERLATRAWTNGQNTHTQRFICIVYILDVNLAQMLCGVCEFFMRSCRPVTLHTRKRPSKFASSSARARVKCTTRRNDFEYDFLCVCSFCVAQTGCAHRVLSSRRTQTHTHADTVSTKYVYNSSTHALLLLATAECVPCSGSTRKCVRGGGVLCCAVLLRCQHWEADARRRRCRRLVICALCV